MNTKTLVLAGVASVAFAVPVFAHHSFAMFDVHTTKDVAGTVKEFEWINPHVWLNMTSVENGKTVTWSFEAGGPGQLAQSGWKADTVKPGDKLVATVHPLKDGSHGGQLLEVTFPNGKKMCQGADCRAKQGGGGGGGD